jgi:hypothetical protein
MSEYFEERKVGGERGCEKDGFYLGLQRRFVS